MSVGTWRKKLKVLIEGRTQADAQVNKFLQIRDKFNHRILKIMLKHQKEYIELGGLRTQVITANTTTLDERGIVRWYKRKGLKPPLRQIFDVSRFEQDITNKKFPAKLLAKYSDVQKKDPYIRISKAKRKGNR